VSFSVTSCYIVSCIPIAGDTLIQHFGFVPGHIGWVQIRRLPNLAGHGGDGQRWGLVDDFDMDVGQNGRPRGPQM